MVFENIIEEISTDTAAGFAADYVQPGPKASALLAGSYQFFVRFAAKKVPAPKESNKNTSKKQTDEDTDADAKPKSKRKTKKKAKKSESPIDLLQDSPESRASGGSGNSAGKRTNENMVLPKKHTDALLARVKKLISMWAEEVSS